MAYDPYARLNAPLPDFSQFKPPKTGASPARAFNQGVQQNRNLRSGPSRMMQTAAQYGGGWSPAYQSVYETTKASWAPYGTDFAKTKEGVDRQMSRSASRQTTVPDMSAYRPGRAQLRTSSGNHSTPHQAWRPQQQSPSGGMPQSGLQSRAVNFDGSVTERPNYALRDAFAQNINSAMMPYYQNSGTYLGEGTPPPTWGQPPQFNFPQLYRQATNMVAGGYQNPLAGLFG